MEGNAGKGEPTDLGQQRRAMLSAIEEAISDEDYEFATQIASTQGLLGPTDLIEYMDVKRRATEDPVEQRRWGDGIRDYWSTLQVHQFTPDEIERLDAVKQRMEFDSIVNNQEEAEVTDIDEVEEKPGWEEDKFSIDMDNIEIQEIRQSPVFMQAERAASGVAGSVYARDRPNLDKAVEIIENASGEARRKMRVLLDWYVFIQAERAATGVAGSVYARDKPDLDKACSIIARYASDSDNPGEITEKMHRSLDKHVFEQAKRAATGDARSVYARDRPNLDKAKFIVEMYSSGPERAKAMLRELGFI